MPKESGIPLRIMATKAEDRISATKGQRISATKGQRISATKGQRISATKGRGRKVGWRDEEG